MLRPRFLHGDEFNSRKIAVRTRVVTLSKDCRNAAAAVKLTKDNGMFGPRFLHGYARLRAQSAIANAIEHSRASALARAIALARSRA